MDARRSRPASQPPAASMAARRAPTSRRRRAGTRQTPYVYDKVPRRDERFPDPVQHGRERRGVHLGRVEAGAAEAADDVLQAAARDRRARDDGQHHRRDAGQAVGLLPRHDAAALGRGPARDDGRGRVRRARHRLADARADQLHLVARAEHAAHADRAARRALLHRAGPDAEDRQALRVGGRPATRACRSRIRSRTSTGPTRCCTRASAGSGT